MLRCRVRRLEAIFERLTRAEIERSVAPRRLQSAQDIVDLLEEQVQALRTEPALRTIERARALAYLASVARKAIETSTLTARLECMEQVLKHRSSSGP